MKKYYSPQNGTNKFVNYENNQIHFFRLLVVYLSLRKYLFESNQIGIVSLYKFLVMRNFAIAIAISLLVILGCTDNSDLRGTISGKVTPGGAAFVVRATSVDKTFSSSVDGLGNYSIPNLPYSTYSLQVHHKAGYTKPNAVVVNVNALENQQQTINLLLSSNDGNIRYTLDGIDYSLFYPLAFAANASNGFLIGSSTANGQLDHWSVSVNLNGVNGPGTYSVGNTSSHSFSILKYVGQTLYAWGTNLWRRRFGNNNIDGYYQSPNFGIICCYCCTSE